MKIEDFQTDFSNCVYNLKRIRLSNDVVIVADDYEINKGEIILIYGYHRIAYLRANAIKKVCDDEYSMGGD